MKEIPGVLRCALTQVNHTPTCSIRKMRSLTTSPPLRRRPLNPWLNASGLWR